VKAPVLILLLLLVPRAVLADPGPEEILRRADEVRNPQTDYTATASVTSMRPGKEPRVMTLELLVKGRDRAVIRTLSPAADRGRVMLMRGLDLWAYLPTISKPLRISLRERLIGEVANADITRSNFSGDYDVQLDGSEKIGDRMYYRLLLSAKAPDIPYARIIFWVEQRSYYPFRAEFYGLSGKVLKRCVYDRYKNLAGRLRPSRVTVIDPILKGQQSIIEYDHVEPKPLPDKLFNDAYLRKLS
jgi:outer membrane lipoprotein-sorting protein